MGGSVDNVDIKLLRIFLTIADAGGFAASQAQLNLSLSTISTHMTALETSLGIRLCNRGRAGFSLTEEGRQIYAEAQRLFSSLGGFESRVAALRSRLTGQFSIGIVDNTITDPSSQLDRVFGEFADRAPNVRLSIVTRPPNELLRMVMTGDLNATIGSFPKVTLGLNYENLYQETQNLHCGSGHPLFHAEMGSIDVETVRHYRIIGREYWGARDLKVFSIGTPHAVVSDMEAEARLILSGRYLGFLPSHYAKSYVESGLMRSLRPEIFSYRAAFQLAYDKDRAKQPVFKCFRDIVLNLVGGKTGQREERAKFLS